jgi:hypothetical protein
LPIRIHDLQTGQCLRQVVTARMQLALRRCNRLVAEKLLRKEQISSFAPEIVGSRMTEFVHLHGRRT